MADGRKSATHRYCLPTMGGRRWFSRGQVAQVASGQRASLKGLVAGCALASPRKIVEVDALFPLIRR